MHHAAAEVNAELLLLVMCAADTFEIKLTL